VRRLQSVRRFFKTPKGLLLLILSVLTAVAAPHEGPATLAPGLASAVLAAGLVDAVLLRTRRRAWSFPDGAVLSALFVAMVLSAQGEWYYAPLTAVVAVVSKYVVRSRAGNVFNPAALAIVVTFEIFGTGQSWWGALPEVVPAAQGLMVAAGLFITDRVNRMPLVLTFLAVYFSLFTTTAFVSDPVHVAEIFRAPDLQAVVFFACFILTDPPTSPVKYHDQMMCGVIVAVASYVVFEWIGAVHFLLAGVLVGNVWEAWRRVARRTGAAFPGGLMAFLVELSPWRSRRQGAPAQV
jgi:Na+-translocating ferredoxin:NAD+ oxidoreductase RnfD subunit